jgi:N-acetylglutamate synthase-like GNAT family acetyltransferase
MQFLVPGVSDHPVDVRMDSGTTSFQGRIIAMENEAQRSLPEFEIREAGRKDCDLLANLIRDSFEDVAERYGLTRENAPTHPYFCTEEWVKTAMDKGVRFFVLEYNGKSVGCVAIENGGEGKYFMERLAILPEARRMGLGKALVKRALEAAGRSGARDLLIGVIAGELDLLDWYRRLGFSEVGRKSFEHLPFEVVFMSHRLSAA